MARYAHDALRMNARSPWSVIVNVALALGLALGLLSPGVSLAAPASPAEAPGAVIGRAVVETLVAHRKELAIVAAAGTHEVVATSTADLEKLLEQDLATHGPASRIVAELAAVVTRAEMDTMTKSLHDTFLDECPRSTLRECFKAGFAARSHELTAEVMTEVTSRWWVRALMIAALLFLLTGTAAMTALLFQIVRRRPIAGL